MTQNNAIGIDYSDQRLRVLVEEYITQQRGTFSLQGACAYVLYWAMEDGHTLPAAGAFYQSDKLSPADLPACERYASEDCPGGKDCGRWGAVPDGDELGTAPGTFAFKPATEPSAKEIGAAQCPQSGHPAAGC